MRIYPAIDMKDGKAVRLIQGDYNQVTIYNESPANAAKHFQSLGATRLHLVDLDGAKSGKPENNDEMQQILQIPGLFVQVGGGIRTEERVEALLSMGAGRVILGTAAVKIPAFAGKMAEKYGERIAAGVDARNGKAAVSGWLETSEQDSFELCQQLYNLGVQTIIYTDIAKDGLLAGANLEAYQRLAEIKGLQIIASGGITAMDELFALEKLQTYGAIVGKALYTGHIDAATLFARFKEAV